MRCNQAPGGQETPFTLYVEGPRDRSILRAWAYRLLPSRARKLFSDSVILGGRRPDRAIDHFRSSSAAAGLCVLDRDGGEPPPDHSEDGLSFFIWGRRHIESYLLVPVAIRRALALPSADRRLERTFDDQVPHTDDDAAWRNLDAKRLLGPKGALPRALGCPFPLTRIARVTRETELHEDVLRLFDQLRSALDPSTTHRTVEIRTRWTRS